MAAFTFLPPSTAVTVLQRSTAWRTSDADWEPFKNCIRGLYLDEDIPLKEVMATMERDHGFKATVKMYKNRITKWGLDKKNKEPEMLAVIRKKRQRDAVGKASAFHIRGRPVNVDDVHRYLKRKGISVEDVAGLDAPTPPELRCCTPDAVPQSPTDPDISGGPQQVFIQIRHYVFGSIDSRTWFLPANGAYHVSAKAAGVTGTLFEFQETNIAACELLDKGSHGNAGNFLIRGSALIRDVLLQEDPQMLGVLFDVIVMLRNGWVDCSNIILRQFSGMANTIFPELHPVRHMLNRLESLDPELAEEVFAKAWESLSDVFDQAMGASSITANRVRMNYIYGIDRVRNAGKAEAQLRAMVERCMEEYGDLDEPYGEAVMTFVDFLYSQKRYTEAAAAAEEVVCCASQGSFPCATEMRCRGMDRLASCHYKNYDDELAESTLRQVIDVSSSTWGWQDGWTLRCLSRLERWLTECGKHEAAARVSAQLEELMSQSNVMV